MRGTIWGSGRSVGLRDESLEPAGDMEASEAAAAKARRLEPDCRTVRSYLELFAACEESPSFAEAARRQAFRVGLVKVWLEKQGPELDGYVPDSEEARADHQLRLKAAAHLFRLAAPDRAAGAEEKVEAVWVNAFGTRLGELVAALPGHEPHAPTPPDEPPLLVEKRSRARQLHAFTVDADSPPERRVRLREEIVTALHYPRKPQRRKPALAPAPASGDGGKSPSP